MTAKIIPFPTKAERVESDPFLQFVEDILALRAEARAEQARAAMPFSTASEPTPTTVCPAPTPTSATP